MAERTVDEVNAILAGSYNDQGIERWWTRTRKSLGNMSPMEAWDKGYVEDVYQTAVYLVSDVDQLSAEEVRDRSKRENETPEQQLDRVTQEFVEIYTRVGRAPIPVKKYNGVFKPRNFTEAEEIAFKNLKTMWWLDSEKGAHWTSVPMRDLEIIVSYYVNNKQAEAEYNKKLLDDNALGEEC